MRDYDPTLGRYIQADPLGLVDGAAIYSYALQNPGRYIDPNGENAALVREGLKLIGKGARWVGKKVKENFQADGPGKGLIYGNGRVFGLRFRNRHNVFRLDLQPYPGTGGKSRLHCHIGPWTDVHIPLDPRRLFDR